MQAELSCTEVAEVPEGITRGFTHHISRDEVDRFALLSGDLNPLHTSDEFAQRAGFPGRVVHGALLGALLSRLVGMYLPGERCLLLRSDLRFLSPAFLEDIVDVWGQVEQVSTANQTLVIAASITRTIDATPLTRGRLYVSLTQPR